MSNCGSDAWISKCTTRFATKPPSPLGGLKATPSPSRSKPLSRPFIGLPTIIMFRSKVLMPHGLQASDFIAHNRNLPRRHRGRRSVRRVLVDVAYDAAKAPGQRLRVRRLRSRHQLVGAGHLGESSQVVQAFRRERDLPGLFDHDNLTFTASTVMSSHSRARYSRGSE